jgi:hypothetical protein
MENEGNFRDEHWLETSVNDPFNLHMPPSFAMKTTFGLSGVVAIVCWSGCRLTTCVPIVMSVKCAPCDLAELAEGSRQHLGTFLLFSGTHFATVLDKSHSLMQDLPN